MGNCCGAGSVIKYPPPSKDDEYTYGGNYSFVGKSYKMSVPVKGLLSFLEAAILELFDFDEITHESDGLLRRVGDTESLSSDAITIKWRYSEEEAVIRYDFIVKGAVLENRYDVLIPNDNYSKIDAIGYVPGSSFKFNLVAM